MGDDGGQASALVAVINERLGPADTWAPYPGGWSGEIEAALVDAVFSANARYGSKTTGVRRVIQAWRDHTHREPLDDLAALLADVENLGGPDAFADALGNHQRVPGGAPDRPLKTTAVVEAARALVDEGASTSRQLRDRVARDPKRVPVVLRRVGRIGAVTVSYFLMLLGVPDIKADRMICRFVESAIGQDVTSEEARGTMVRAAGDLGIDARRLDHAAWDWQRRR